MPAPALGTALITGAGVRIGRAIALELAHNGYDLVLHGNRSRAALEDLAQEITALGRVAKILTRDLSDPQGTPDLMAEASALWGPIRVLVNNASVFFDDRIGQVTAQQFLTHLSINLLAPVLLAQAFAAQLPPDLTGVVINLIDQRVLKPNPQFFTYSLSKAALYSATKTLAQALAPRIRVNGIGPGPTLASIHQSAEDFATECQSTLLGHGTSPKDIAKTVIFLLNSPAITGQMIAVDGGQHLNWQTKDLEEA